MHPATENVFVLINSDFYRYITYTTPFCLYEKRKKRHLVKAFNCNQNITANSLLQFNLKRGVRTRHRLRYSTDIALV